MEVSLWLLVAALLTVKGALAMLPTFQHVHTKFQYKQSFKGPYMINAKGQIPYWNHGGSKEGLFGLKLNLIQICRIEKVFFSLLGAIPSEEQVRVCPSIKSRTGELYSCKLNPTNSNTDHIWYHTQRSKDMVTLRGFCVHVKCFKCC